jgi:hypothetical protein
LAQLAEIYFLSKFKREENVFFTTVVRVAEDYTHRNCGALVVSPFPAFLRLTWRDDG